MNTEGRMALSGVEHDLPELMTYRIRGEFLEMPGLHLTLSQATRLWHMDAAVCADALRRLVGERFLTQTRTGAYIRADRS
jgi:hypothetical protein